MTGALALLLLVRAAWSAPEGDDARRERLVREQAVAVLAGEVARARAEGAPRSEVARLLAAYRAEAEALAAITAPLVAATADEEQRARSSALAALRDAVAKGTRDDRAREVLAAWLGEPAERLAVLARALTDARALADPALGRALSLDTADQAAAVALVATYDAAVAAADADRAESQAAAERARSAPGAVGSLSAVIEAERLEREAVSLRERQQGLLATAAAAAGLASSATRTEESP